MTDRERPILQARRVTYGFPERPRFLQSINLDIAAGQCWGVIGPNGAGKSTLLRLLAGLLTPSSGSLLLRERPLSAIPPRARAQEIAFLSQHMPCDLPTTSREIVLMGRFPHRRFGLFENAADFKIAEEALATTEASELAERSIASLSGGEAQRVHIAAAIAQQPAVLLLDEPTASLDLYHELSIFSILRDLAIRQGLAVVVVTHDINLAARFCTDVLLLNNGCPIAVGPPSEVIVPALLASAYNVEIAAASVRGTAGRWMIPLKPLTGNEAEADDKKCDTHGCERGGA